MRYIHNGRTYRSKKHPLLEHIFLEKNPERRTDVGPIRFTLQDITRAYDSLGIAKPSSISNTIQDLLRQDRGKEARMPQSLIALGFDLRRVTGTAANGESLAGEFVYVGMGGSLSSWIMWPEENDAEITLSTEKIPAPAFDILSNDEAALFSVLDHCDILSKAINDKPGSIRRVQNPLKLQPNEVDGFYISEGLPQLILYPIEAKGLSTGDSINADQFMGAVIVCAQRFEHLEAAIEPLAIMMIPGGMRIAEFEPTSTGVTHFNAVIEKTTKINLSPPIPSWI